MVSLLKAINNDFTNYTGRILPQNVAEKVSGFCEKEYWSKFYSHDCKSLDTFDREFVFDLIAKELVFSEGWPMNGSHEGLKNRFTKVLSSLKEKNND